MGIASDFNKLVHNQIQMHAAWFPVTNTYRVGEFGKISNGVFTSMGNIESSFHVTHTSRPGPEAKLSFSSDRVTVVRLTGGAEVAVFPDEPLEAKLQISFERSNSFYVKALLTSMQMESPFEVARQLATLPAWRNDFKVVSAVYEGKNAVVLSNRNNKTAVEIGGKANVLKKLELGDASADLSISTTSSLGLEVMGQSGVIGLRLFQIRGGQPEVLSRGSTERIQVVESPDMPAELEDDV